MGSNSTTLTKLIFMVNSPVSQPISGLARLRLASSSNRHHMRAALERRSVFRNGAELTYVFTIMSALSPNYPAEFMPELCAIYDFYTVGQNRNLEFQTGILGTEETDACGNLL